MRDVHFLTRRVRITWEIKLGLLYASHSYEKLNDSEQTLFSKYIRIIEVTTLESGYLSPVLWMTDLWTINELNVARMWDSWCQSNKLNATTWVKSFYAF